MWLFHFHETIKLASAGIWLTVHLVHVIPEVDIMSLGWSQEFCAYHPSLCNRIGEVLRNSLNPTFYRLSWIVLQITSPRNRGGLQLKKVACSFLVFEDGDDGNDGLLLGSFNVFCGRNHPVIIYVALWSWLFCYPCFVEAKNWKLRELNFCKA